MHKHFKPYLISGLLLCTISAQAGWFTFVQRFVKNPKEVSALFPCSSFVGKELVRYIKKSDTPKKILEVGAGDGAITEEIVKHLRPEDSVDVIEIDPVFCDILHKKFDKYPQVTIHCMSILDWKPEYKYDAIISTLPFNNLDKTFIQDVFNHYQLLVKENGFLSYVEYMALPHIKRMLLFGKKKQEFEEKLHIVAEYRNQFVVQTVKVFRNLPPLYVHHLRLSIIDTDSETK